MSTSLCTRPPNGWRNTWQRALGAACLTLAAAGTASADPVAQYSFSGAGFVGGGTVSGSFSGVFTPSGLTFPFGAGTGHIVTPDVIDFAATFSGNVSLPDASFERSELQSLRLVDASPGAPAGTPLAVELRAFDLATEVELLLRLAVSDAIADALFGNGAFLGLRVDETVRDDGRRDASSFGIEFVSLTNTPPAAVPVGSTLWLALAALAALAWPGVRRASRNPALA